MGPDGKYYSYEWLGPLADWVAFVANVGDNFDMLGQAQVLNRGLKKLCLS